MFENTPSDRVQFRALGELPPPGACLICGSGNSDQGYVDLGVYIDYLGQAMLCVTCVIQVGEVIKMLSIDEAHQLNMLMSDMRTEVAALKATVEEDNDRLAAYALLLRGTSDPAATISSNANDVPSEDLQELTDGSVGGESAPEESGTDDGGLVSVGATEQDNGSKSEPVLFEL